MARTISFEGRQISVPDDASDEEVAQIIGGQTAAPAAPSDEPSFLDNVMADLKAFPRNLARGVGVGVAGVTEGLMAPLGMVADYPFNAYSVATQKPVTTPTQELSNRFDQILGSETKAGRQVVGIPASLAINPFSALPGMGPAVADLTGKTGAQELAKRASDIGMKVNPANPNLNPSWQTRLTSWFSNTPKVNEALSRQNQGVFQDVARKGGELLDDEPLTREMMDAARTRIGDAAYNGARAGGEMVADEAIVAAQSNPAIARIIRAKVGNLESADAATAVDAWKQISADARGAWKSADSPPYSPASKSKAADLDAAADALKAWIDRSLRGKGMTEVAEDFSTAPQRIAQSHTLSDAVIPGAKAVDPAVLANAIQKDVPMRGVPRTAAEFARVFPEVSKSPISPMANSIGESSGAVGNLAAAVGSGVSGGSGAALGASMSRGTSVPGVSHIANALLMREGLQRKATGQAALPSMMNDKEAQARAILAWLSNQENK